MPKRRILIVDDEPSVTRMVKLNLENTGHYIVQMENSAEHAVAAAREFQPELILLDVVMPDLDGGAVAARLQADNNLKHIPIVFLTAMVNKEESGDGSLVSGGMRFLAKPADARSLIRCIEENLPK